MNFSNHTTSSKSPSRGLPKGGEGSPPPVKRSPRLNQAPRERIFQIAPLATNPPPGGFLRVGRGPLTRKKALLGHTSPLAKEFFKSHHQQQSYGNPPPGGLGRVWKGPLTRQNALLSRASPPAKEFPKSIE